MDDLDWDWRPQHFRPPFTIVHITANEHNNEYRIMAEADNFSWEVVSICGSQEDAMRLLDLVALRYEMEVVNA